jgi:histidinol-phosphate aminotransferase
MSVLTRADLEKLPLYVPGRNIPGAVKLASNESSDGPLPGVLSAIASAAGMINRYPDTGAVELVEALAAHTGAPVDRIAVGCGSVMLCEQLMQATCAEGDEVMFAWRSFEAYPLLARIVGARINSLPLTDTQEHDLDAMAAAITPSTRLVFVCNPNNPTGTAVGKRALLRFLDAVPENVLVVLDEAYREFVDDPEVPDGLRLAAERDNVAVLRTFSKAYGLAGLRLGYCVASEPVARTLRKVYVPFSVNSVAQAAAIASLAAHDELLERCAGVIAERTRVTERLRSAGFEVPDSQANFVWLRLGARTAAFNEHCLDHKVVVRAFPGDGIRVTVGHPEENDAFLGAAESFAG